MSKPATRQQQRQQQRRRRLSFSSRLRHPRLQPPPQQRNTHLLLFLTTLLLPVIRNLATTTSMVAAVALAVVATTCHRTSATTRRSMMTPFVGRTTTPTFQTILPCQRSRCYFDSTLKRQRPTTTINYYSNSNTQQQYRISFTEATTSLKKILSTTSATMSNSNFKIWMTRIDRDEKEAHMYDNDPKNTMYNSQQQQQQEKEEEIGDKDASSTTTDNLLVGEKEFQSTRVDESSDNSQNTIPPPYRHSRNKRKTPREIPPPLPTNHDFPSWAYDARPFFRYELLHQSTKSHARVGRIHTPHGVIETPAFVAVATNAALKGIDFQQLPAPNGYNNNNSKNNMVPSSSITSVPHDATATASLSSSSTSSVPSQLIFCNTYHLMIQPGAQIIGDAGGIHEYTKRRNGPFITDSGGFQVFSLAYGSVAQDLASKGELKRSSKKNDNKNHHRGQLDGGDAVQVTEDGVIFRSYRDGNKLLLTPETTVQAQKLIGADIIIPLDELPGYYVDRHRLVESVARTHRWEARSLQEHLKDVKEQAMYCVIHGGMDYDLRKESVDYLTSLPFDGYGIGGSLGNGRTELQELLSWLMPMFNGNDDPRVVSKPRHLLGIADEESIRNAIPHGIDTFDSCYPTRLGRHGTVLTRTGTVKLQSGIHARSFNVKIDAECTCTTCQTYDRAYLCHLFKANEPIATTLAATHNLHYMYDLMAQLRQDIMDNKI